MRVGEMRVGEMRLTRVAQSSGKASKHCTNAWAVPGLQAITPTQILSRLS